MTLNLRNITCARGDTVLCRGLNMKAARGEVVLVRGPNGSGKTSLLRLIAGLLRPAEGDVQWSSEDADPLSLMTHYLGHLDALKPALTVRETLEFWKDLLGGRDVQDAIEAWHLDALADLPCGILSAGQRRRVALARLDLAPRPLWLLDEPTGPLDDAGVALVENAVRRHCREGGIAIIATHRSLGLGETQAVDLSAKGQSQ